jgi:hypothetical protein
MTTYPHSQLIEDLRKAGAFDALPYIIACQGPPICTLEGDDAVAAIEADCPWCKRITVHEDGSETVSEPSRA